MWNASIKPLVYLLSLAVAAALLSGCEIDQKETQAEDGFLKLFNHPEETLAFYPEGLLELDGDGYLFLSAVKDELAEIEYPSSYITRCNAQGQVEWSMAYDWFAPVGDLFRLNGQVGFVAMDEQFRVSAILIDPSNGSITATHDLEMTMPLAAGTDSNGNLLVLGYDFDSRSSWISKFNGSFSLERSVLLPVNTDLVEVEIQRHMNKMGQEHPFYIGQYSTGSTTGYYVSCYYNYTLRTIFLDQSSLAASGDIFYYQTGEAISSIVHKNASYFGLTSYYEGNNYILPYIELNLNESRNIRDLPAEPLYELSYKAPVATAQLSGATEDYTLFASQTNASELVIYQYAASSDSLISTHYRGFDEQVRVSQLLPTEDGGAMILGGIHILGKYRRPFLLKFPPETFAPKAED
ncbi:MAG: hypothetical protein CSA96_08905 [Bacteroidetes bacterium]|nr:MAG: hypothetical protein CSA96_08905 [Bacteroidota bacterium]